MAIEMYSFIIPVYNRPQEIKELLESFTRLEGDINFEIVIIEDGSTQHSQHIVEAFSAQLNIKYYYKDNSGPGDSRNFGMKKASADFYIILDSDVILPKHYLRSVALYLNQNKVDCFGGPDAAHHSFSDLQKAINFAMTSFLTTGGIRGNTNDFERFQPRSFNMGLSKKAFLATKGFGQIHPGEDPDLVLRLWKLGFKTTLIKAAYVYHKRRISWKKFYQQVYKFGVVRNILNHWHPQSKKFTYWFPTLFTIGFLVSILLSFFFTHLFLLLYLAYFLSIIILSLVSTKSISVALKSLYAVLIQFFGYGYGFLKSYLAVHILKQSPNIYFKNFFFNK